MVLKEITHAEKHERIKIIVFTCLRKYNNFFIITYSEVWV